MLDKVAIKYFIILYILQFFFYIIININNNCNDNDYTKI